MSLDLRNLAVLAYANGFNLWHYRTEAPLRQVVGAGDLDDAADLMAVGDLILIVAGDGATVRVVARCDPSKIVEGKFAVTTAPLS